ncbi:MAG TPA: IS91 family transposase [Terracidiphilus sp.]|nr:IS91 family transposase [Candidatus Acidoferrales bacterium]HEV2486602.1 IS91 family transposase [Terracidiphilus sp.]
MPAPALELADIFRIHGPAYRETHDLPLHQLRLMRAIENCRTPVMGGVVEWCDHCQYTHIQYRSCRNRHCPKCQGLARAHWLQQRQAELLPVSYFHVVFTVPEPIAQITFYNKEVLYNILFRATAETILTIAGDPRRLGVETGFFAVLHSWGQNLHFHPHLHCVIPGGGLAPDGSCWSYGRRRFLLPVKVLSTLFRRLFLEALQKAYANGQLQFFGQLAPLADPSAFSRWIAPLKKSPWVVYAKAPFGGPQHVLEYLGRYTHRVAISNQRLLKLENGLVAFQWKDYRDQQNKVMTVPAGEFIRLFLQHSLPTGLQRIRYYGFLANCHRAQRLALCRQLLASPCADLLPRPGNYRDFYQALTGRNLRLCPRCRFGAMRHWQTLFPTHGPIPLLVDTS